MRAGCRASVCSGSVGVRSGRDRERPLLGGLPGHTHRYDLQRQHRDPAEPGGGGGTRSAEESL